MARNAITVLKLSTINSSNVVLPTLRSVDTGTGAYVDLTHLDAGKLIFIMQKTATGANTAANETITIEDGDSKAAYSNYTLGDLSIVSDSDMANVAGSCNIAFCGPFESARFKDSDGHIKINATAATNIGYVGAIWIPT